MAHRWTPREISETIDIALMHPPGSEQRKTAADDLAERVTDATPNNPLAASAANTAAYAACCAIDGDYSLASEELIRQVKRRRAEGTLVRRCRDPRSGLGPIGSGGTSGWTPDERRLDRLIDVCLTFPPRSQERQEAAQLVAPDMRLVALSIIDDAIDGRYAAREVLRGLWRIVVSNDRGN